MDEPAIVGPLDALDSGVELDAVEDAEILRIVAQIGERFAVRGVGRILLGHRVILEARVFARRDEIGGVVDDARASGFVPKSSDVILALEAVERNAALGEVLAAANPDDPAPIMQTLSVSFLVSVDCMSIEAKSCLDSNFWSIA